jgi:nitrite reductase (NADH) large subunit
VLATGSNAVRLDVPGKLLPGVRTLRDLADVRALRSMPPDARVTVIGGGLLGVEVACGLAKRGCTVRLLHLMPRLMERQLDARAGALLKAVVESRGVEVLLQADTAAIEGNGKAQRVVLGDGRSFAVDLVVMAAGIRPETQLAASAGIEVGRGVKVDDKFETNWPAIYAIGECAEHRGRCYGLVEPVYEQARVLARHLAGLPARYEGTVAAASLKISGIPLFSMGHFEGQNAEAILLEDEVAGCYRKLVIREGRLVGALLFGDTSEAAWYRELVASSISIEPFRENLAFGRAIVERVAA